MLDCLIFVFFSIKWEIQMALCPSLILLVSWLIFEMVCWIVYLRFVLRVNLSVTKDDHGKHYFLKMAVMMACECLELSV